MDGMIYLKFSKKLIELIAKIRNPIRKVIPQKVLDVQVDSSQVKIL